MATLSSSSAAPIPGSSPAMSFHEMVLLQTEFQLDEIKDEIQILRKNKAMTDAET